MITWMGKIGGPYRVESSPDLASWTDASGDIFPREVITTTPITLAPGTERHFFRVVRIW